MTTLLRAATVLLLAALCGTSAYAQSVPAPTTRDGHADFNFLIGKWHTHYRRLAHPLSHDHTWYSCYGTSVITPFWNGSGDLEDGDLRCPHQYIGGMTLRMYNADTHQWSLYFGTKKTGLLMPPQVGHFEGGVGEFFAPDTYKGKPIDVRYRWSIVAGHPHFEQAFSSDGGKTWETNWTTDYTRVGP